MGSIASLLTPAGALGTPQGQGGIGGLISSGMDALGIGNQQAVQANIANPISSGYIDPAQNQRQIQAGMTGQQNLVQALQAQNGLQNQSNVFNQMQGVANGTGPNPALAQLANTTGQNVAQQAALMGSQRGSGSNPALMARQASMQGANIQQQGAGQAAAMQAQQQMAALNQLSGMANQQAGQQIGATNAYTQAAQNNQQTGLNALGNYNQAQLGNVGIQNQINSQNQAARNQVVGNLMGGAGAAMGMPSGGGMKPSGGGGGNVDAFSGYQTQPGMALAAKGGMIEGPKSRVGQHFHGISMPASPAIALAKGGQVPAMLSPGEKYLSPDKVEQVSKGADPMSIGKEIPGKPKVSGAKNSYDNDTVPATLEEGGIVLPRSVTQSKNPHWAAHKFVSEIMARQAPKKGK